MPVNLCGNTVDVVGVLNPAFGNTCASSGTQDRAPGPQDPGDAAPGHSQPPGRQLTARQAPSAPRPSGRQQSEHSRPSGRQPLEHQTSGHRPPDQRQPSAQRAPGVPRADAPLVARAVQAPGHRPPPEVAGAVESRALPAAQRRPAPAASPAGGKGREITPTTQAQAPALAHTGSSGHLGAAAGTSAALLLGGAILYRRRRSPRT